MALDPRIAMGAQVADVQSALMGGYKSGEYISNRGVRDALLDQQQQSGQLALQQQQQQQAVEGLKFRFKSLQGLMGVPVEERAARVAQMGTTFEQYGIDPTELQMLDLSNAGIENNLRQLAPFMEQENQREQQLPADIQEFQFYQGIIDNADQYSDEVVQAARIKLKTEAPARDFTPKIVEVGGAKYMQVGDQLFNPTTAEPVSAQGEAAASEPTVMTPQDQIAQKAEAAAAVTTATATARQEVGEESIEAQEQFRKSTEMTRSAIDSINSLLSSDRLDDVTGLKGQIPTVRPQTKDLLNSVGQLDSILTAENLGIMTGVLSETDIKIIAGIANDLGMQKNEKGNVTSITGSYAGTVQKLKRIKSNMIKGLNAKGVYLDGQTVTNPSTGQKLTYINGNWEIVE